MFWTTLYYMKMVYGLLSFPFLIFRPSSPLSGRAVARQPFPFQDGTPFSTRLPLLGRGLVRALPTAYDQSGALVPKLTSALMKKKKKLDDRARAKAQERHIRRLQAARKRERKLAALREASRLAEIS